MINPITKFLSSLTYLTYLIVAGVLAVLLIFQTIRIDGFWFIHDGLSERLEDCEASAQRLALEAVLKANDATEAATATVTNETASVADSNAKAREAAEGSDDPLADGLGALRE